MVKTTSSSSTVRAKNTRVNRDKERAYISAHGYASTDAKKEIDQHVSNTCPKCSQRFVNNSSYHIHRKSCGEYTNGWCSTQDYLSSPEYLADVRGEKYAKYWKNKPSFPPKFALQKWITVLVNEETGKKKKMWHTVKMFDSFNELLEYKEPSDEDEEDEEMVEV